MKIVAMLTSEGTACSETALYDDEDTPRRRAEIEAQFCQDETWGTPVKGSWTDCSDNEYLRMNHCNAHEWSKK